MVDISRRWLGSANSTLGLLPCLALIALGRDASGPVSNLSVNRTRRGVTASSSQSRDKS